MESEREKQPRQSDGLKHGGLLPVSQENRDPRPSLALASPHEGPHGPAQASCSDRAQSSGPLAWCSGALGLLRAVGQT